MRLKRRRSTPDVTYRGLMRCGACHTEGHKKNQKTCPLRIEKELSDTRKMVLEGLLETAEAGDYRGIRNLAAKLSVPYSTCWSALQALWHSGELQRRGQLQVFMRMLATDRNVTTKIEEGPDGLTTETVTTKHGMPVAAGRLVHDIAEATAAPAQDTTPRVPRRLTESGPILQPD